MDSESDSINDSASKNLPKNINSKDTTTSGSTNLTNFQNLNNEGNQLNITSSSFVYIIKKLEKNITFFKIIIYMCLF